MLIIDLLSRIKYEIKRMIGKDKITPEKAQGKFLQILADQIDYSPIIDGPPSDTTFHLDMSDEKLSKINPEHDYKWLVFTTAWTTTVANRYLDKAIVDTVLSEYVNTVFSKNPHLSAYRPDQFMTDINQAKASILPAFPKLEGDAFNYKSEQEMEQKHGDVTEFICGEKSNKAITEIMFCTLSWLEIINNFITYNKRYPVTRN